MKKKYSILGTLMVILNVFLLFNSNLFYSYIDLKSEEELKNIKSPIKVSADHKPPTISIVDPSSGSTVNGNVLVNATASDNVGVDRIEFYIDDVLHISDTSSPYEYIWDTTNYTNGIHQIKAIAYDAWGNYDTDIISVTVDNSDIIPPTVSIVDPSSGSTVNGNVLVNATASDNVGVSNVEFYIDTILEHTEYLSPYEFEWDTTSYSNGMHEIKVIAYDAAGNNATDTISVTVDNSDIIPPTVSITNPSSGLTVNGTFTITATASDNIGVTKVEFYIDNYLQYTDTSSSYQYEWDTTKYSNGTHEIKVIAYDATGNTDIDTIDIDVINNGVVINTNPTSDFPMVVIIILIAIGGLVMMGVVRSIKHSSHTKHPTKPAAIAKSKYPAKSVKQTRKMNLIAIPPEPKKPTSTRIIHQNVYVRNQKIIAPLNGNQHLRIQESKISGSSQGRVRKVIIPQSEARQAIFQRLNTQPPMIQQKRSRRVKTQQSRTHQPNTQQIRTYSKNQLMKKLENLLQNNEDLQEKYKKKIMKIQKQTKANKNGTQDFSTYNQEQLIKIVEVLIQNNEELQKKYKKKLNQ